MLVVDLNKANLSYDVLALVKSFYPTEDVKILTDEVAEEKRNAMDEPAIYVTVTDTKTQLLMKEEEKKPIPWEAVDPKPPVIHSGRMENRRYA